MSWNLGFRLRASYRVGTPNNKVGFLVLINSATWSGVNEGTRILFPPPMNTALTHTPSPNPWNIGKIARAESLSDISIQVATCVPSVIKL